MNAQSAGIPLPDCSDASRSELEKLVTILALPRSGTTVLTAILSVHSRVISLYEPWNANQATVDAHHPMSYDMFLRRFVPHQEPGKSVLVAKETATDLDYTVRIAELLDTAPDWIERHLIIPLRNPFHVFLSEVQARREWWGANDLRVGAESFQLWAARTLAGLRVLATLARKHNALLISYDRFSADPAMVDDLNWAIGLVPQPNQREFERHLDQRAVRGDINVARSPHKLTAASVKHRAEELETVRSLIDTTPEYALIMEVAELFEGLPALSRASQNVALIDRLITIGT